MLAVANETERASKEQLRTAFDHATTGLTLVDDSGRYVRVNRAFADLLDYGTEELVGRSFREITADTDHDADVAVANDLISRSRRAALREKRYAERAR
ncbi:PAS domain S-box protein [Actinoplanes sp. Pm04-4]|uniref:PAS domain S-box protein n=1 Tax=Paractinoplanes pyxinae TaxID=2997416 RepID=A0ABT4BGM5_9ACTN|nr:PAS domain S-box protein [Actinoplanes pyxinae]MCY1145694.1 PAS domain S-box protein [Actinoplanes pyxinae]